MVTFFLTLLTTFIFDSSATGNLSAGQGCANLRLTLERELIPNTDLATGAFYVVRLRRTNSVNGLPSGYITWTPEEHPESGHGYVYADTHGNMENYLPNGIWYWDSQWAFLKSNTSGWYSWINCGYPFHSATWSNWDGEYDVNSSRLIIDNNMGNRSADDFLFRPVKVGENIYKVYSKDGRLVTESGAVYSSGSYYMEVSNGRQDHQGDLIFQMSNEDLLEKSEDICMYLCTGTRKIGFVMFSILWIAFVLLGSLKLSRINYGYL